ncbi:MAG: hypothetical protein AAF197_13505, partial [Pseudomonadota bacterium]
MTKIIRLSLTLSTLLLLGACATNPTTGGRILALSESWELQAGKQYHPEILKQYSVYDDPELQAYVNELGQKLAKSRLMTVFAPGRGPGEGRRIGGDQS